MEKSESISALAASLVTAQTNIKSALKDSVNPHFRSHYADLASVVTACKSALNDEGIAVVQSPEPSEPGQIKLQTVLVHKSGEWMAGTITMPLQKNDPQGYGSALTYARRYGLAAMVNVCSGEDDDGNAASGQNGKQAAPKPLPRPLPAAAKPEPKPEVHPDLADVEINDDEIFVIQLRETFSARDFSEDQINKAIAKTTATKGWGEIRKCPNPERRKFIDAVNAGKFDKFKQPAMAGAR
jgi:hypothetical protein